MMPRLKTYVEQNPEDILFQVERNLCGIHAAREAERIAEGWKRDLESGDFSSLVLILNKEGGKRMRRHLRDDDFEGAVVYPNQEGKALYEAKHRLPAISFGIAIPERKWKKVQQAFGMRETSQGFSFGEYGFSEDSRGLNRTGLSMHIEAEGTSYQEFEQLYEDIQFHSRSFTEHAMLTTQKAGCPWKLSMALLYRTMRDISAWRYQPGKRDAQMKNLTTMLSIYGTSYENVLFKPRGTPQDIEAFKRYYATVICPPIHEDIPRAIDAVYALEEQIGPAVVTPLLFSLGTVIRLQDVDRFYSPLNGIIKAREYFETGELRETDITRILARKGYRHIASA